MGHPRISESGPPLQMKNIIKIEEKILDKFRGKTVSES